MKTSNSEIILGELAERAGRLYGQSVVAWIDAAYLLLEAREVASHGEWASFLEHAGIPQRTARRMLQIARAGFKSDTVTDLGGIRTALEFIAAMEHARENWKAAATALTKYEGCGDAEREGVAELRSAVGQAIPDGPIYTMIWLNAPEGRDVALDDWLDFAKAIPTLRVWACRELSGDTA